MRKCELDPSGSGWGLLAGSCKHGFKNAGNFFSSRGILCFSKRFAPWSEFQEHVDLCDVNNDVDSSQRNFLISKADLSFPEYSKIADKSTKLIEKDLFCLSAVSSYRALTFF
jgi:hypothetical protein